MGLFFVFVFVCILYFCKKNWGEGSEYILPVLLLLLLLLLLLPQLGLSLQ